MGVLGLWQLLAPVGQPVILESLENKIFAVDISIWLNQALKGYRDSQGGAVPNAHLLSLFSRLCKLLFYKIRPIVVFDGGFPELKKQTIINRNQRRAAVKHSSRNVGLKILANYLASKNLGHIVDNPSSSKPIKVKEKVQDEIFKLPPLPESFREADNSFENSDAIEWKFHDFSKKDIKYLNQIDIESEDFNCLPPDVKQEILSTLKESRKHRTWEQFEELPKESHDFSNYQMQCLLKRRKLQSKLEQVQKDIQQMNSAGFIEQYTSDHVIGETNKIMSDDCSHYVLLRKIMQNEKSNSDQSSQCDEKNNSYSMVESKNAFIKDMENIDVSTGISSEVLIKDIKKETEDSVTSNEAYKFAGSFDLSSEEEVDNPPIIDQVNDSNKHSSPCTEDEPVNELILNSESLKNSSKDNFSDHKEQYLKRNYTSIEEVKSSPEYNEIDLIFEKESAHLLQVSDDSEIRVICENHETFDKFENASQDDENLLLSSSGDEFIPCNETETPKIDSSSKLKDSHTLENKADTIITVRNDDESKKQHVKHIPKEFDVSVPINPMLSENSIEPSTNIRTSKVHFDSGFYDIPSTSSDQSILEREIVLNEETIKANLDLQKNLDTATALLEADQAKQDRQSNTVQEHMVEDCKELLRLFGIPYVVSPTEAEAQCAFYDYVDLTHGTITDDSDVWLFGGKRVYKNFFTQQKYVEFYKDKEIFAHFGLSRLKLINFAMLTGSDYTEGIEGVGPVTAMEILSEFPGEGIDALYKFKHWWTESSKQARPPENKIRAKLQKLVLAENFPDNKVFDAYLQPVIDESTEKFSWGRPDLDSLRDYMREKFGWNKNKVDDALLPVIKKLNERDSQTHLDNFFTVSLKKHTNLFPSKRIMSALKKMTSSENQNSAMQNEDKPMKRKSKSAAKTRVSKKKSISKAQRTKNKTVPQGPVLSEESSDEDAKLAANKMCDASAQCNSLTSK